MEEKNSEKEYKEINENYQNAIEELIQQKRKDRRIKTCLIIIIIILLIITIIACIRMGRIGYRQVSGNVGDNHIERIQIIKITQENVDFEKIEDLDIFVNERFNNEKIIAPHSKGEYRFCIENIYGNDLNYNINFTDNFGKLVNMKYKLKIDNIYIRGNENKYVDIEDLDVEDIIVLKGSNNIYTLEWYWEDNDSIDAYIGNVNGGKKYMLNIGVEANIFNK